ncbi:PilW family protein [Planctomycetota bacterium]
MKISITNDLTDHSGFTLIELLLVMLISSILVMGISASYRQARTICSNAEDQRPIYHDSRIIIESLRTELSCLYFPSEAEGKDDDGGDEVETNKGNNSFEVSTLPNGTTELTFYTLYPWWKGSLGASRMAKVRYHFTKDRNTGRTVLERFEQPCAEAKVIGVETSDILLEGLSAFNLLAADPNSDTLEWKASYNSKNAPPKAIKLLIKWPAGEKTPEITFETSILIPCQGVLREP